MDDVALAAGVSRSLVSLAINGSPKVAGESRATILAAAEKLGYRINLAARNLAARQTSTVGVLLNDLHNPFFAQVFDGLAKAAVAHDQKVLLTTALSRERGAERNAINAMIEHRVDGMVLVGPRLPSSELSSIARTIPVVVTGRVIRNLSLDCVTNDDRLGAHRVVEHLHHLGHRNVAHIDGANGAGASPRRSGFVQAAKSMDMTYLVARGDFTEAGGSGGARFLLDQKLFPTAVFAANDLCAVGAFDVFVDSGLNVPGDISVVGYDNSSLARMAHLSLTTVDQSTEIMGEIALELLMSRIGGRKEPRIELVEPTLQIRKTTSSPRVR